MDMARLKAWRDNPGPETERYAKELVARCGALVLDRVQYRIRDGRLEAIDVRLLGLERIESATGIETMKYGGE